MLSFFRINDPLRLIGIIILLGLIRFTFLTNPDLIFIPEIKWMLLGEKLANGNLLYEQIWDTTAPLSALSYAFIHITVGKSILAYRILSTALIIFYSFYYSKILINNVLFLEKTFVPAVVFGILCSISVDCFTLSPPLLGLGFILIALNYLYRLLDKGLQDNQYYNLGFLIGLASLFYLPYLIFLALCVVGMFLYSNTSLRQYLLMVLGYFFPLLVLFIFYSLYYGLDSLYYMYFISFLTIEKSVYVVIQQQVLLIIMPILFAVLGLGKLFVAPRFVNYQQKAQQLMFFYIVAAAFSYIFIMDVTPSHLIVAVPGFTFFISHYFLLIRRKIFSELVFILFLVSIPLLCLGSFYGYFNANLIDYSQLVLQNAEDRLANKKILVLGDDMAAYKDNSLASPYLNWKLSKNHFKSLKYYEIVLEVNDNLAKEMPEVIIDKTESVKALFQKIPSLSNQYQKCGDNSYCLKRN